MAKSQELHQKADKIAIFDARIEELQQDGVYSHRQRNMIPWAEAAELDKLGASVWAAFLISLNSQPVPGDHALASIERNIDYERLPPLQRKMLLDLRQEIEAGRLSGPLPEHGLDRAGQALNWIAGIDHFDREWEQYKANQLVYRPPHGPWAELSESGKVSALVGLASDDGPPGVHALAAIEREVDYGGLPPWRREALEGLRARLDAGELIGHQPNDTRDQANYALRLAEFEARVEDYKHFGGHDFWDVHRSWAEFSEVEKLDKILTAGASVDLHFEPREYEVIERDVDLVRVPEFRRQGIETNRKISHLRYEEYERRPNATDEQPDKAAAFKERTHETLDRLPSPSEIAGRRGSQLQERPNGQDNGQKHESDNDRER